MNGTAKGPVFGLIGGTIWGNRGAEAMTCAAIARMRERVPGARFRHISYYPAEDAALITRVDDVEVVNGKPASLVFAITPFAFLDAIFRLIGVRLPDAIFPKAARQLRGCAALLDVQGISFDDGRLIFLPYKILSVLPAIWMGVPVFKLSQAMGPFKEKYNRLAAKWVLPQCTRVFARGEVTRAALDRIGVAAPPADFAPDVGFAFQPGDSLSVENQDHIDALRAKMDAARASGRVIAALAPSTVVLKKMDKMELDYVGLLARLVEEFRQRGVLVLVFPNANRRSIPKPRNNDFAVMDMLAERLAQQGAPDPGVVFVEQDINFDGILTLLDGADVLVSSRFHGMVAGLSRGVPTMVVGWSHKYAEVLKQFGVEEMAVDYADAIANAPQLLDRLLDTREEIAASIAQNGERVRAESCAQFDTVAADLSL